MYSALITLITFAAAPGVFAQVGVHCGTTSDATFSDCQALTDPATNPDDLFAAPAVAYNTACHGNCCVYFASKTGGKPDKEKTRQDALSLLGCADQSKNKINGLLFTEQAYGVCISNGKGCGDCFDDKDFSGGCANC
ncbi:hypothetical protein DFH09DRAFT_1314630 [Mycena vulgaris]|nr:hypothetical protein DFH09DRAFT_1314630 [Mycena vulgaris]